MDIALIKSLRQKGFDPRHPARSATESILWYLYELAPDETPSAEIVGSLLAPEIPNLNNPSWLTHWQINQIEDVFAWESDYFKVHFLTYLEQAQSQQTSVISVYQQHRLTIVNALLSPPLLPYIQECLPSKTVEALLTLKDSLEKMGQEGYRPLFLIVPGTFNPMHIGHQRMIEAAIQQCVESESNSTKPLWFNVVLSVGTPSDKSAASSEARADALRRVTQYPVIAHGDHIKRTLECLGLHQGSRLCLVRGVRNDTDRDHEVLQKKFVADYLKSIHLPDDRVEFYYYEAHSNEIESSSAIRAAEQQLAKGTPKSVLPELEWRLPDLPYSRHPRLSQQLSRIGARPGRIAAVFGPIASGKSTVSAFMKEQGYYVINLDLLWADFLKKQDIRQQLGRLIPGCVNENDALNKEYLRAIVFDAARAEEKKRLEGFAQGLIIKSLMDEILTLDANQDVLVEVSAPSSLFGYLLQEIVTLWIWVARDELSAIESLSQRPGIQSEQARSFWEASFAQVLAFKNTLPFKSVVTIENRSSLNALHSELLNVINQAGLA